MSDDAAARRLPGREEILSGVLDSMVAETHRQGGVRVLPVAERTAVKRAMLDTLAAGEDAWLFAYGSLIWNPAFRFVERRPGLVHGYHRRFCFWSTSGRGTPELPGLMLALEPGGSCHGAVYRVRAEDADRELQSVFLREMMTEAYRARWVAVRSDAGPVRAIAFIANPAHPAYAGRVAPERAARHIAAASGRFGACRDYLRDTVRHLAEMGLRDRRMDQLLALVEAGTGG